ncbi:MAG: GTPase HflX [Aquimonas sp.]|nr:GTPase HflX [Aquimonas sp.]
MFEREKRGERALLIQPQAPGRDESDSLEEFSELARSAGASVLATLTGRVDRPNPALYIGSGKAEEAKQLCALHDIDLVLVNATLSPVQERNLEKHLQCRVVDRTGLILDIFSQRARSFEGKLQVELAQLKHVATRLVRGWTHLERQRGGSIGLRGPGETQLETDRRLLAERVKVLSRRLEQAERRQAQARRARLRNAVPRIALVGYTNAGKSTLFNALTGAGAYAADQLFATLDPTVRRLDGLDCGDVVLADTVGFVSDLPHELVAAFRSTLSEAREADLLLHVIDAADPLVRERIADVEAVLAEIGAGEIPQVQVFNKIDRVEDAQPRRDAEPGSEVERVFISARDGLGLDLLRQALSARFASHRFVDALRLEPSAGRIRARLFALGAVRSETVDEEGWELQVDLPLAQAGRLAAEFPECAAFDALRAPPPPEDWEPTPERDGLPAAPAG